MSHPPWRMRLFVSCSFCDESPAAAAANLVRVGVSSRAPDMNARPFKTPPAVPALGTALDNARMLKTLLANVDGMVYRRRLDADWTMEFISQGCARVTGYQPADILLNKNIGYNNHTKPEKHKKKHKTNHKTNTKNHTNNHKYRILHADGTVRWVWE